MRSPYKTPKTLDETYLEAVYELTKWLHQWREAGLKQPKWTPATSATFAWQHALERVHATFGGVMRTPVKLPRYGQERLKYQSVVMPEDMPIGEGFSEEIDITELAELSELREAILEVLGLLPPATADAIFMHFFQNMNFREIGRRLGITGAAVSQSVQNGIEEIQRLLGEDVTLLLHEHGA